MSVQILYDEEQDLAVMYCNTTDWAFGPVFDGASVWNAKEAVLHFFNWLKDTRDPRVIPNDELEKYRDEFTTFLKTDPIKCKGCEMLVAKDKVVRCPECPEHKDDEDAVWCNEDCREDAHL